METVYGKQFFKLKNCYFLTLSPLCHRPKQLSMFSVLSFEFTLCISLQVNTIAGKNPMHYLFELHFAGMHTKVPTIELLSLMSLSLDWLGFTDLDS